MKLKLNILLAFLLTILTTNAFGVTNKRAIVERLVNLETELEEIAINYQMPSISIGIVDKSGLVWSYKYGYINREQRLPVTDNSVYRIGSVSKIFTAISVMQLVETGQVSLNTPLAKLLPNLNFQNNWKDSHPLLLSDLLEHTSGFEDLSYKDWAYDNTEEKPISFAVEHFNSLNARWPPGTIYSYSNRNTTIAARVVEVVSGLPFEKYVENNIFTPLGMSSSSYYYEPRMAEHYVTSYVNDRAIPYTHILDRPSGSVNSSLMDLANLMRMFINKGKFTDTTILKNSSITRIETPQRSLAAKSGIKSGYALANYSFKSNGLLFRGHSGSMDSSADFFYAPSVGLGYIILLNSEDWEKVEGTIKIEKLIQKVISADKLLKTEATSQLIEISKNIFEFEGVYIKINPRRELERTLTDVITFYYLKIKNHKEASFVNLLSNSSATLTGRNYNSLHSISNSHDILAVFDQKEIGEIIDFDGEVFLKVGLFQVVASLLIIITFFIAFCLVTLKGFLSLYRNIVTKETVLANQVIYLLPSTLTLLACIVLATISFQDLGQISVKSLFIYLYTILYPIALLVCLMKSYQKWKIDYNIKALWLMLACLVLNLSSIYFGINGLIGIRTWEL